MAISKSIYSSESDEYETPKPLFDYLNSIFHFELDPCAKPEIEARKRIDTAHGWTQEHEGLSKNWVNLSTFVNPPYSQINKWIDKALEEYHERVETYTMIGKPPYKPKPIVLLVPARTDTKWFHKIANYSYTKIVFLKGRLKFNRQKASAPFPSCLIILAASSYMNRFENTIHIPAWTLDVKSLD
jgi:phage N-6-adenine-methyltransferase